MRRCQQHLGVNGLSVVIPTLNEAHNIVAALERLHNSGFEEIVVADGGSGDGTRELVIGIPNVILVDAPRGRGQQIGAGVAATRSPLVIVLHADTQLPAAAAQHILHAVTYARVAGGCFRLNFDSPSPLLRVFAAATYFDSPFTTFGDQAFFFWRAAYEAAGGAPDCPLFEDVELRRRLMGQGRFVKLAAHVTTSARRFEANGAVRNQLRNVALLLAYRLGWPPDRLARYYHQHRP